MVKDDGRAWLVELTQSITGQLKQNREDIADIYTQIRTAREHHSICREQILGELAKIDKRVEVVVVRISIYIAIFTFLATVALEFLAKHWVVK